MPANQQPLPTEGGHCTICFSPVIEDSFETNCSHIFHRACIAPWIAQPQHHGRAPCPNCRGDIENIADLFFVEPSAGPASQSLNRVTSHSYNLRPRNTSPSRSRGRPRSVPTAVVAAPPPAAASNPVPVAPPPPPAPPAPMSFTEFHRMLHRTHYRSMLSTITTPESLTDMETHLSPMQAVRLVDYDALDGAYLCRWRNPDGSRCLETILNPYECVCSRHMPEFLALGSYSFLEYLLRLEDAHHNHHRLRCLMIVEMMRRQEMAIAVQNAVDDTDACVIASEDAPPAQQNLVSSISAWLSSIWPGPGSDKK